MRYLPQNLREILSLGDWALRLAVSNAKEADAFRQECEKAYEHAHFSACWIQYWYRSFAIKEEEEEEEEIVDKVIPIQHLAASKAEWRKARESIGGLPTLIEEEEEHVEVDFANNEVADAEFEQEAPIAVIVQEPKKKGKKKLARELESSLDGKKWAVSGGKRSRKQRDIFCPC